VGNEDGRAAIYLIATRLFGTQKESIALPVSGDCEFDQRGNAPANGIRIRRTLADGFRTAGDVIENP